MPPVGAGSTGVIEAGIRMRNGVFDPDDKRRAVMMQIPNRTPQPVSRVNEIVADVLSTTVLILVAIVSVAQFASY